MRQVSERFKEIQDELMRPPLKLYFEVDTDVINSIVANPVEGEELNFDTDVAPIVPPSNCANEHYYAVVGDGMPVDDPNRICAPGDSNSNPNGVSVPYGITEYHLYNSDVLIGCGTAFYANFVPFVSPVTLSFKGGLIPDVIIVERYDTENEMWYRETTINNSELNEEIVYTPPDYEHAGDFRCFYVKNTTQSGRFQLNWIRSDLTKMRGVSPIVFENTIVSSVNISQETDLTSQALPQYEMTVECLDVDEIYTPDSDYWKNQFAEGKECFLKIGYEIGEGIDYLPFFFGKITKVPTYSEGKITFNIAVVWKKYDNSWSLAFNSIPNSSLNTGDIVDSCLFKDYIEDNNLFDSADVFHGNDDEANSGCNYYGEVDSGDIRQLIANALGCFITTGINTFYLHNTVDVQYDSPIDNLTRYEQVQNTLDPQPKVSQINVVRNENIVSEEYVVVSPTIQFVIVEVPAHESCDIDFVIPFYSIAKTEAQSYPHNEFSYDGFIGEHLNTDGTTTATLRFTNTTDTTQYLVSVKVKFYKVSTNKYEETESLSDDTSGEAYINDNFLITNGHTANKAEQVAKFMNDASDQYEVDVIQNFLYETGDPIRVETQKNIFKTCIITGLQFVLPGSSGHVTCRRIFSLLNCSQAVLDPIGLTVTIGGLAGDTTLTILETSENGCVLGYLPIPSALDPSSIHGHLVILGATKVHVSQNGSGYDTEISSYLTDLNGHDWGFKSWYVGEGYSAISNAPIIQLPVYDYSSGAGDVDFGIIELIKAIYTDQGMTAPVDYTCVSHNV